MDYVLILSLGPIQDFIASARRCRDLWFGSWLLSELSKAAARGVAKELGLDALVFPGVKDKDALAPGSKTSVANKIVAIVKNGKQPKDVAEAAKVALDKQLAELRDDVFARIRAHETHGLGKWFQPTIAQEQISDLIEFLWVAAPIWYDLKSPYAEARATAESLLAQRKRTMLWRNVPWSQDLGVPKSSLDGQRESVLNEKKFPVRRPNEELDPKFVAQLRKTFRMKPNERLCGVGLLKRLGKRPGDSDAHQFLSTPHLATGPLLQRIEKLEADVTPKWREYIATLDRLAGDEPIEQTATKHHKVLDHYDGMLLMETRLEEWFDHLDKETQKKNVRAAQSALQAFFKATGLPKPKPYFAVLLADGDNMGKAIAARDDDIEHRKLSQALDEFAQNAHEIVETDHDGELIYSGGDDVLAFVPLNKVIQCAQKLAQDFARRLKRFADKEGIAPTLSVGIAICHFIEPMGHALDVAREAEKKAKSMPGKNALAIILDKRSGPPIMVCGTWDTIDKEILEFATMHRDDAIPDGVAHELLELETLRVHSDDEKDRVQKDAIAELIPKEAKRILNRKRARQGAQKVDQSVIDKLLATPQQLAERLLVAKVIADAQDIAEGKRKPTTNADDTTEAA